MKKFYCIISHIRYSKTEWKAIQATQLLKAIPLVFFRVVSLSLLSIGLSTVCALINPCLAETSAVIDFDKVVQAQASQASASIPTEAQIQSGWDTANRYILPKFREKYGLAPLETQPIQPLRQPLGIMCETMSSK